MDRIEAGGWLGLDPSVVRRMEELFGREVCAVCGSPAARLRGGRFHCARHFEHGRTDSDPPRVYRCAIPRS